MRPSVSVRSPTYSKGVLNVQHIICLDLEGVLVPEIWIGVAEKTGIKELSLTTRDIADYDELMQHRLKVLDKHGLGLADIQSVIQTMAPMPGALDFVRWIKQTHQLVILSDTFYEFAGPLMAQLEWPTLLCHRLNVSGEGRIVGYTLRQDNPKAHAVKAFKALNYPIIAAGDSYNDTTMLAEADLGILFRPPQNVIEEFPQYEVTTDYDALKTAMQRYMTAS